MSVRRMEQMEDWPRHCCRSWPDGEAGDWAQIYPAASGLNNYATFRELADASVLCTGLRANLKLCAATEQRHLPVVLFTCQLEL